MGERGGSRTRTPPHSILVFKVTFLGGTGHFVSSGDFSWEDDDTLPQKNCKPSQDLIGATL